MERRSFITASSALLLMPKLFAAEKVNQNTFSKELSTRMTLLQKMIATEISKLRE